MTLVWPPPRRSSTNHTVYCQVTHLYRTPTVQCVNLAVKFDLPKQGRCCLKWRVAGCLIYHMLLSMLNIRYQERGLLQSICALNNPLNSPVINFPHVLLLTSSRKFNGAPALSYIGLLLIIRTGRSSGEFGIKLLFFNFVSGVFSLWSVWDEPCGYITSVVAET